MSVRTRFAPSPTGYLHIGGVRTALFCWLFARRYGGQFILRIDDTDAQRHVEESLAPILRGLHWLGIDWDEGPEVGGPHGPYFQSQRVPGYQTAAAELLARGFAYRDYATQAEVQAEREAAQREKRPFVYSRRFMAETAAQQARFEAEGRQAVVRLKMPREGTLVIDDLIRGRVEFQWAQEQDHVIQRTDGSCLYHLASVVDDHVFEISHVIRAEEHLSNTPRQVFIIQSLGYPLPQYAHLPFVAEPGSHTKLSKRKLDKYVKNRDFAKLLEHGRKIAQTLGLEAAADAFNPVVTDFYQQVGYLPEALLNYLALLGWSLDDKTDHFTRGELIEKFSLDRVNKSPASFDPKKLWAFQDRHMQDLPLDEKVRFVLPFLQRAGMLAEHPPQRWEKKIRELLVAAGDRIKVGGDILNYTEFFCLDDQLVYEDEALTKVLKSPGAAALLRKFRDRLSAVEPFDPPTLDRLTHEFAEAEGAKLGEVIQAVRMAVSGKNIGVGLYELLAILGRESCLARIDRALGQLEAQ